MHHLAILLTSGYLLTSASPSAMWNAPADTLDEAPALLALWANVTTTSPASDVMLRGQPLQLEIAVFNPRAQSLRQEYSELMRLGQDRAVHENDAPELHTFALEESDWGLLPMDGRGWLDYIDVAIWRAPDVPTDPELVYIPDTTFAPHLAEMALRVGPKERVGLEPAVATVSLAPASTAALPHGTYYALVEYDSTESTDKNAWKGTLSVRSEHFTIRDAATPAEASILASARIQYFIAHDMLPAARAETEQVLQTDPTFADHGMHATLGHIHFEMEAWAEAKQAYESYLSHVPSSNRSPLPTLVKHQLAVCIAKLAEN